MADLHYKRVLLKLSGEQLAGAQKTGIDAKTVRWIATEIKTATDAGAQVVVMVGGGNYVRGAQVQGGGIKPVTAHYMGMLGTMINGLAVADIFNDAELPAHVLSSIFAEQIADPYTQRRAVHHLNKGRVVIIAGGTGRPYVTTDTAAVNWALELDCDLVCKLTNVDGVYDKDPNKSDDAKRFAAMSFQEAVENPNVMVMDKAALGLAMEYSKPILVFNFNHGGNVRRMVMGEPVGTLIS